MLAQFNVWAIACHLLNLHAGGTVDGTRVANSVWVLQQCCDGVSVSGSYTAAGTFLWTGTFTPSKLVMAASGTAHSWAVFRNANLGFECCIDLNSATAGQGQITFTRSSAPFGSNAVGTTTTRPTAPAGEEFCAGSRIASPTPASPSTASMFGADLVTGGTNYSHALFGANGEFIISTTRVGMIASPGGSSWMIGLWPTINQGGSDSRNVYALFQFLTTGRGAPSVSGSAGNTAAVARNPDGTLSSSGGLSAAPSFGGTNYCGNTNAGQDLQTGQQVYWADPIFVREFSSSVGTWDRGQLRDIYWVGTAAVNGSYPSVAAQTHLVQGDWLVPWPGTTAMLQ